jgi:hypothetical protein
MNNHKTDREKYHELAYYTLSLRDPPFIHQHVVDAFAAQQADKNTKPITLTFALVGLYLHLEKKYSGREVQRAHMRLAKQKKQWPKFDLPEQRGAITVADVLAAKAGSERVKMIDAWCAAVWEVYGQSHQKVADLVETELGKSKELAV